MVVLLFAANAVAPVTTIRSTLRRPGPPQAQQALILLLGNRYSMVIFFPRSSQACSPAGTRPEAALPAAVLYPGTYAEDFSCLLRVTWINGRQKQGVSTKTRNCSHGFSILDFRYATVSMIGNSRRDPSLSCVLFVNPKSENRTSKFPITRPTHTAARSYPTESSSGSHSRHRPSRELLHPSGKSESPCG